MSALHFIVAAFWQGRHMGLPLLAIGDICKFIYNKDTWVCPYTYNHIHNKIKDFYFVLSQLYANFAC